MMASSNSGYYYSHPEPGEEIFISGIAGYFPKSDSVAEFQENLFNKLDLISNVGEQWKVRDVEAPPRVGKINKQNRFDGKFFGMDYKRAHHTDPMARLLLERTYEALIDAGVNPAELRNTNTGVFVGSCFVDTDRALMCDRIQMNDYAIAGCARSNLPVRLAEWLGLNGPTYNVDTACSSSMFVLDHAYKSIRDGRCDAAIVGGVNLSIYYEVFQQFARLGLTSPNGLCKCFDESANGYVRAESIAVCFLQKAKDSRRVYAQLVHVKTNCDGFKQQNILFPSATIQAKLLNEFYHECDILPEQLEYMECHCTGTWAGDREEMIAVEEVLCKNRSKPLLVGTVKSNMGHSEPVSGLCSLAKVCIAYNTGYIPPNINITTPRKEITAISEGKVQIVTDKQQWSRGYVAINNFGFGGANAHCLVKDVGKSKIDNGRPQDHLPRLVCVSGRTRSAVEKILQDLETRTVDVEEIGLWHAIHEKNVAGHNYRGYTLLHSVSGNTVALKKEIHNVLPTRQQVCFLYTYLDKQIMNTFSRYMEIPPFAAAIYKCHEVLTFKGLNLLKMCSKYDSSKENLDLIITVAIQIAITDVLKKTAVLPDYITGEGLGELCCAYADDCLTDKQTILAAYDLTLSQKESNYIENGYKKIDDTNNNEKKSYSTDDFFGTAEEIRKYLQEQIPYTQRSQRWCYTDSPRGCAETKHNGINNALQVGTNPIVIGITSQNSLDNKNIRKEVKYIPLFQENTDIVDFLQSWSRLFMLGLNPHLAHLYPSVQFPVSQGTPMLSHLVEWDHRENWSVEISTHKNTKTLERRVMVSLDSHTTDYLKGHNIDGRVFYPGTGYLILVWETLALTMSTTCDNLSVVFEDVRWERATVVPENDSVEFVITLQKVTGEFEITENETTIVNGRIFAKENVGDRFKDATNMHTISNDDMRMTSKDFYKEIMFRGYRHSGLFQGILDCDVNGTHSRIAWVNNWVVFLDNLLQTCIISNNNRSLLIPTRLEKLSIDTNIHYANIKKGSKYYIDVFNNSVLNLIRSAGVEVRGLFFNRIGRTIAICKPTLERYEFLSYFGKTDMKYIEVLQAYIQIILENMNISLFKSIELFHSRHKNRYQEPTTNHMEEVLNNIPNIDTQFNIITDESLQVPTHINILKESDNLEDNAVLIIGADLLSNMKTVQRYRSCLLKDGFMISREQFYPDVTTENAIVDIVSIQNVGEEYLVLLRCKIKAVTKTYFKIDITDSEFSWLDEVKKEIGDHKVVLYAQNEYTNGLIGFVNCLTKEPVGTDVCAFLITDPSAPPFEPSLEFYQKQIDKNLCINVFQEGQWGSYRHLPLTQAQTLKKVCHAYNNLEVVGDISTLTWYEGPLNDDILDDKVIHVYSSSLNFRDVMVATGRIHDNEELPLVIKKGHPNLGLEIVGRTANGSRVMCLTHKGFSNKVLCDDNFMLPIPDEWTFEEAATIIIVYSTVYVGFAIMANMCAGESVLIHAGAGGVGQAAINVALHLGCEVFTTVGSPEKRTLLKKLFPQLKESHIGCSRDTSFEEMIRKETNGRGVDVVLNCLADDILQASVRCLANRGRFLEIGKYDIEKNTLCNLDFYEHEISYHSVMLDKLEKYSDQTRQRLLELMVTGIASGAVRPLTFCSFDKEDIESAYRYMASGKHIGKLIVNIRDEEKQQNRSMKPTPFYMDAVQRYTFNPDNVFIIVGGLGGFGLELADWLVMKGATKLVLVSSRGITNGYQKYRIRVWQSLGVNVQVCTQDVTSETGCEEMLMFSNLMGTVEGIFNLAAILKDALFQEQTQDSFKIVYKPKAVVASNLDKLSRKLCPQLKDFVMFSSLACGHGNAGQTNYGLANSVMDRICEKRKKEGMPALSIQWGLIGEVGLVAEMLSSNRNVELNGLSTQSISSCLETLDKIMRQDAAIVSSCVIVEKKNSTSNKMSLVDAVAKIKGIRDLQAVSPQATLIELGMDSMMAVEIKQALERDFKIFLTPQEIRKLTFARLAELNTKNETPTCKVQESSIESNNSFQISTILKNICDEKTASKPYIFMSSIIDDKADNYHSNEVLFMVPGFEGFATVFEDLCSKLHIKTCVLQLGVCYSETLDETIERLFKVITKLLSPKQPYKLLGYSFGVNIILGLAAKLEKEGHNGTVFCLDGSPSYLQRVALTSYKENKQLRDMIISCVLYMIGAHISAVEISGDDADIESELDCVLEKYYSHPNKYSKSFIKSLALSIYNRYSITKEYRANDFIKIVSPIVLFRVKEQIVSYTKNNYDLDSFTDNSVTVHDVTGNHSDLPNNCAPILDTYLTKNDNNM